MKVKDFATFIAAVVGLTAGLFIVVLFSTVFGGFAGWVVGFVFPVVIASLNTVLGLSLTGFQMGTMLGFVGSFLSTKVHHSKD